MTVNPDAVCNHPYWGDGLCGQCGKECEHPTFTGYTCSTCFYTSSVENPAFVTYQGNQYVVNADMTVVDFILNKLYIAYEFTIDDGHWEWSGKDGVAKKVTEGAKLSDFSGRYITLTYVQDNPNPCQHYFIAGECTLCSKVCHHQQIAEGECITCHMSGITKQ